MSNLNGARPDKYIRRNMIISVLKIMGPIGTLTQQGYFKPEQM